MDRDSQRRTEPDANDLAALRRGVIAPQGAAGDRLLALMR